MGKERACENKKESGEELRGFCTAVFSLITANTLQQQSSEGIFLKTN